MKKSIFFLILLATLITTHLPTVKATSANFYEAEYIKGIWMNRTLNDGTIHYQTARFYRRAETGDFAYCIEPFSTFKENEHYEETINPYNLTPEQIERISLIAHFGYGYTNHYEEKWYAITQFMIWQAANPNADFYFTNGLNGNRVTRYQQEIEEINNTIKNYQTIPSLANKTYNITEGQKIKITDNNYVINEYQVENQKDITIGNNSLIINNLKEGEYPITLTRQQIIYNKPIIFYQAENSQNLMETGDLPNKKINLNIKVKKTSLKIIKIDSDTKTTTSSGNAKLEGAIYQLYDSSMKKIDTLEINKEKQSIIKNLTYGKYYLQEINAGVGYQLDKKVYSFELTPENTNIELKLENKVIKGKIIIHKLYGNNDTFQNEENINFNIYDHNNNLVETIITNKDGLAEIELPYGTYTIIQQTSTEGYQKVEPITIDIKSDETLTYTLKDYKIKVPDTKTTTTNLITFIIELLQEILW